MPYTITITDEAKNEAQMYEDAVGATRTLRHSNYTKINQPHRYYYGYIGEWAFNEFLKEKGVEAVWNRKADGLADSGDFVLDGKTIDVKTASKPEYRMLMFPNVQKHPRDLYVGVRLNGETAEIWGYTDINALKTKDFGYGLTKYIPLDELISINLMFP